MRQPAPPLGRQLNDRERLAVLDALALSTGDIDTRCPLRIVGGAGTRLMIGVRSTEQLKQLKPDYSRLTTLSAQLGAAGFFVFTLSHGLAGCLTESRMFCPALGIPEDPVSGNAHGLLGAYLAEQGLLPHAGATAQFTGAQGHHVHRAGRVDVELEFSDGKLDGVWIVGQAVEIFETEMSFGAPEMGTFPISSKWAAPLVRRVLVRVHALARRRRLPAARPADDAVGNHRLVPALRSPAVRRRRAGSRAATTAPPTGVACPPLEPRHIARRERPSTRVKNPPSNPCASASASGRRNAAA